MTDNVDGVLAALADPTRLRLLDDLGRRGRATATALAAGLPVTRQAIVKHLAVLQHAGLVAAERRGREVYFAVRPERFDATAQWMATMAAAWDTRLAAIKHLAERERHD